VVVVLTYWLSRLRCPKLNAPSAGCLSGPGWLGDECPELQRRALSLASAVGLDLLRVEFEEEGDDYLFCAASTFPDLAEADAADAI
jgi:hypothetical protein